MPRRTLIRSLFCPPLAGWPEQQIRDIIHVGLCPPLAGVATRQRVAGGGFQPRNSSTPFGLGALRCGWSLGCAPGSNWTPFRGLRRPVLVVCGSPSRVLRGFKSMQRLAWHLAWIGASRLVSVTTPGLAGGCRSS